MHAHLAMLAAAATSGTPAADIIGYLISFGPLGLLLIDLGITRKVFTFTWILNREEAERERERAEHQATIDRQAAIITQLTDNFMTEVVPALTRATDVARQYVETLQDRHRRD